jgi:hypothetical protein
VEPIARPRRQRCPPPPPSSPRTNRTRRVPHPVLSRQRCLTSPTALPLDLCPSGPAAGGTCLCGCAARPPPSRPRTRAQRTETARGGAVGRGGGRRGAAWRGNGGGADARGGRGGERGVGAAIEPDRSARSPAPAARGPRRRRAPCLTAARAAGDGRTALNDKLGY